VPDTGAMSPGEHTRSVHPPALPPPAQQPLAPPVYRTATFAFASAQECADVFAEPASGYSYSRTDNPSVDAFAHAAAALEGPGTAGQAFASGTAAETAVLLALCAAGSHVVAPRELYGGTYALLTRQLSRFGVTASFVDLHDLDAVRAALRPETAVLWAETIANPTLSVADLPGLAGVAHEAGLPLVVDSTFAPPPVCRPLEHGADLVVHSATKFFGGHSDVTGGLVVGMPELVARVREVRVDTGGSLGPDDAVLLQRGLATLPLRVERQCASALAVATALEQHAGIARVEHPGLASHRDHALAMRLFSPGRYGALVTFTPRGGREAGFRLVDHLQLVARATSLGGTVSKAVHVASTTHRALADEALRAAGIDPGAVRLSVGLEDPEDLVADLLRALDG